MRTTRCGPVILSTAPPAQGAPKWIMRHWAWTELTGQAQEELNNYHGFIVNLQYDVDSALEALGDLIVHGKLYFRYLNVSAYPLSFTNYGGEALPNPDRLRNYIRNYHQFAGNGCPVAGAATRFRFEVAPNKVGLTTDSTGAPANEHPEFVPWFGMPSGHGAGRAIFAQNLGVFARFPKYYSCYQGGLGYPFHDADYIDFDLNPAGIFLDQSWLDPEYIVYNGADTSGHGITSETPAFKIAASYAELTAAAGGQWNDYADALWANPQGGFASTSFYGILQYQLNQFNFDLGTIPIWGNRYIICNGDHRTINNRIVPSPLYYENAWNNTIDGPLLTQPQRWQNALAGWRRDRRNILSLKTTETAPNDAVGIPQALAEWEATGGWIAFTDDGTPVGIQRREEAYAAAAALL